MRPFDLLFAWQIEISNQSTEIKGKFPENLNIFETILKHYIFSRNSHMTIKLLGWKLMTSYPHSHISIGIFDFWERD